MIGLMHQHLIGVLDAVLRGERRQRQLRRQPEGIILTHRQNQHGFQGPVGRARRIVILRHDQIRVAIAHAQHAITIEQRLLQPPAEMAQDDALDHPRGECLQPGKSRRAPEGRLSKTVSQAATKRHGRPVVGKKMDKVGGKQQRPMTQFSTALRVDIGHQLRVNQPVEVEAHRNVIVPRPVRAIGIPAVAQVVAFHGVKMRFPHLRIGRHPGVMKTDLYQNGKEVPVIVRDRLRLALLQPAPEMGFLLLVEMSQHAIARQR